MPVASKTTKVSPQANGKAWVTEIGFDAQGVAIFNESYMAEPGQDLTAHLNTTEARWNQTLQDSEIQSNANEVTNADF